MKAMPIPIRVIGPGSQPEDDPVQCLDFPRDVATFRMPEVPGGQDPQAVAQATEAADAFLSLLRAWDPATDVPGPRMSLRGLAPGALEVMNQVFGEGEVSIKLTGARRARIQESVFAGVWRVCELDGSDRLTGDWVEAGPLPRIVLDVASAEGAPRPAPVSMPPGAMNSPALLNEIGACLRVRKRGDPAHVINLTLLPLSEDDHRVLEQALPIGPVAIISHGFGTCRITSTLTRDVWRVQYFNTMNTLILNTLEVTHAPEAALAACDDLHDSRERIAELVAWMRAS
jgi:hydrogenase-1 operon protein HyaF